MKRLTVLAIFALALFAAGARPSAGTPQQITLLHVGDSHSHLAAWGPKDANLDGTLGGLPKAAAIVAAARQDDPNALFVHAGDFTNGDLFFNEHLGVPELQLLQSLGLDALVLGNRDFQLGSDFLTRVVAAAWNGTPGAPILGTNLDPMGHPLGNWITPTLIKDVNGVRVGLFGLTHPKGTLAKPTPVKILPYLDDKPETPDIAPAAVAALRAADAQVVICVTHLGMDLARQLAQKVAGIDVIVNAHDHAALETPEPVARLGGGTTLIVSAGFHYRWVGRLRLAIDGDQVTLVDYALLDADATAPAHATVQTVVDTLKEAIVDRYGDVYHQVLARAEDAITGQWDPGKAKRDTPLGNLFTDAYRAWTGTDIAMEAMGYLGDELPAGDVVGADVFRAMSYGGLLAPTDTVVTAWRLVTFRATGSALTGALEKTLVSGPDYFPQVSGLRFDYDSSLPALHRIDADSEHVGGRRLLPDTLYSVTVTEGVFSALTKGLALAVQDVVALPDLAFDAARSLVAARGELGLAASNRIRDVSILPSRVR